jgi:CheY-like chemotaxis protein
VNEEPTVLLVDDSEEDVFFFKHALRTANLNYDVHVARTGLDAVHYLTRACEGPDRASHPFPRFILTDNRMPVMTGREFLAWLRDHPQFRVIPTVVLGGSASPEDVREAYELGAHSYFVKPMDPHALQELVKMIFQYWTQAKIPPHSEPKPG